MRKTYWFVALGVVALGLAAYPWRPSPAMRRDASSLRAELSQLSAKLDDETAARQREVAKLEAQLRALGAGIASAPAAQPSLAAPPAELEPLDPVAPEPVDPGEHLEGAFAAQARDASWAPDTESRLQQRLREQLPAARLSSLECHASMCRLETVHRDAAAFGQFVGDAFKDPDKRIWSGNAFTNEPVQGAQGELVVVSYLAREGEALPQIR